MSLQNIVTIQLDSQKIDLKVFEGDDNTNSLIYCVQQLCQIDNSIDAKIEHTFEGYDNQKLTLIKNDQVLGHAFIELKNT